MLPVGLSSLSVFLSSLFSLFHSFLSASSDHLSDKLCKRAQSGPTLLQPHGLELTRLFCPRHFQARILSWVAISYSSESSWHSYQQANPCFRVTETTTTFIYWLDGSGSSGSKPGIELNFKIWTYLWILGYLEAMKKDQVTGGSWWGKCFPLYRLQAMFQLK